MSYSRAAVCLMTWALAGGAGATGVPNAGLARHGDPKYKPDFKAFDFANPDAPKGGTLVIGLEDSYDSLNPFGLKDDYPLIIQQLVFQELREVGLDEPFTEYPGVAESFDVAPDRMSITIKVRPEAKFSDGKPVTAEDLVFSMEVLRSDKARPLFKFYWADIKDIKALDNRTVKISFAKENPELPLIATELPVLPKHVYGKGDFSRDFATLAVGTGPYVVKDYKFGAYLTLKRNHDFWGKDLAVFRGQYNFDEITVKYYKDPVAMVEAFKKGDFDIYSVNISKVWALDLSGEKFDKKYIKKELWPDKNNQGMQGFVFNLRRPMFQDVRVRKAITLAFDFAWSNKNLFYNQYTENTSFFENSPLKATGKPSAAELAVLEPLKADLPPEVFTQEVGYLGRGKEIKDRLREAMGLLKEAGYSVKDGVAQGPGGKLEFKFLENGPSGQRIAEPFIQNLKKLGINATIEEKEASIYLKRLENREFDVTTARVPETLSPGNEQREFWGSAAADENHTQNYAGIKNKAVDALIDQLIYAKTREDLVLRVKCLDRVLYHLHPVVHNWHLAAHRIAYWNKFSLPAKFPDYYDASQFYPFLWFDTEKAARLDKAKERGEALP